uniref:Uncharacterized protein n=1 Tax=Panagrolaimus sp. JU765 TaxID=591449 RepID=A0AC34RBG9_9BILA
MINLIGQGAYEEIANPKFQVPETIQNAVAFGFLLLGETPFLTLKAGEILFEGYNDPLLDLGHSEIFKVGNILLGNIFDRFAIPDMKKMAFYYGYNNTNDEEYWVKTGTKGDDQVGTVVSWANRTDLPHDWYTTEQCRMINGTDSGSFAPKHLKKTDRLPFFMSFLCRSFYLEYADDAEVNDIKTYEFTAPPSVFDTTLDENRGMRYPNLEKVNYAKGWPNCPTKTAENCSNVAVDCSAKDNLCHSCCDGSLVNDTYLMPPGLYPLQCYPGRLNQPPFLVQISPPHFAYSPPEISQNLIGMHPKLPEHVPFSYLYEPYSGTPLGTSAKFMINMPIFNISRFAGTSQLPQTMLPFAWTEIHAHMHQSILDYAKLGFTTVPRIVFISKIVTLVLAFCLALFSVFPIYRLRRK